MSTRSTFRATDAAFFRFDAAKALRTFLRASDRLRPHASQPRTSGIDARHPDPSCSNTTLKVRDVAVLLPMPIVLFLLEKLAQRCRAGVTFGLGLRESSTTQVTTKTKIGQRD
jgi:hypothetical protein